MVWPAAGTTVLVTTHYLDEAERCDRVAIIHAGRMAALGTTTELKRTFDDRPIIEVRAAEPVEVMAALDALPARREDEPVRHGRPCGAAAARRDGDRRPGRASGGGPAA